MSGRGPRGLRYVGWTWPEPADAWFDAAGLRVRERLLGPRGPRWDRAWVDEAAPLAPLVDVREAARRLTRKRDLVDECVAVTLREPAWLARDEREGSRCRA